MVVYILAIIFTFGISIVAYAVIFGLRGTYMYYVLHEGGEGTQLADLIRQDEELFRRRKFPTRIQDLIRQIILHV